MYVRPELRSEEPKPVVPEPVNTKTPFDDIEVIDQSEVEAAEQPAKPKKRFSLAALNPKHWHKKQWAIFALVLAILIGLGGAYYVFRPHDKPAPVATVAPKKAAEPVKFYSPLSGIETTEALTKNPVVGVMIENSQDARPQSGLGQAGVVFEAVAEGGITRFLALYQSDTPSYVGPIRSVRPYYLDWAQGFDASVAHVGGSPEALAKVKSDGVKDLDQFYNGNSYTRITGRAAPHNVYSGVDKLMQLGQSKGYAASTFSAWGRKADQKVAPATASSIDLNISAALYNARYDYDPATNQYNRSQGGKPHLEIDGSGNQAQLKPKVVVAMVINKSLQSDGLHSDYGTSGTGTAFIFQDGGVTQASWKKDNTKASLEFVAADGKPVKLNAGQTWISVVTNAGDVTYK